MASVKNTFPEDVLINILLRLPATSLVRFSCICTTWCNLIKSDDFINKHLNRPITEKDDYLLIKCCFDGASWLSVHSDTESLDTVSDDVRVRHFNAQSIEVLGPINGIVCITNYWLIILCNPATREFVVLPPRPFGCPQDMIYDYEGVGFGFDESINDYKVVRIVNLEDDVDDYHEVCCEIFKAEVYQCSTDSWREIDAVLPDIWYAPCFEIFFNGATHWHAKGGIILSFCITTEVFREFDFPSDCTMHDGKRRTLTILNESLAMLSYTSPLVSVEEQEIDVWVMKEYGISESWTKLCTIGSLSEIKLPLTSWKDSVIFVQKTDGQLISCDLHTHEVKEFDIYGNTLRALPYRESLVSIRKVMGS